MANISRDTFNELNRYVSVRLQQGVPLVDADWNEMDDIRRYELRRLIKWYIGDGVPDGNDGFHVLPTDPPSNDFIIKGGDGTAANAGRCLVEGRDVIIPTDLKYSQQTPAPPALTAPAANTIRTDLVYLDVWEREVNTQEQTKPPLINDKIGIETCVRYKLEWAVRVQENCPTPGSLPAQPAWHAFYPLAMLIRQGELIGAGMIRDLRNTGITLSNLLSSGVEVFQHAGQPGKYTSGAIDPGLGKGNIFVSLGVEEGDGNNKRMVVGDQRINDVFGLPIPIMGAQIDPNTGTFIIGLKLEAMVNNYPATRVRWWAFKSGRDRGEIILPQGIYVTINPPPAVVNPGMQITLTAVVHASENQSVVWSLIENDGGTIDSNTGQYTPSKPGIFHIRATSVADASKYSDIAVAVNNCVGSGPDCVGLGQPGVPQHCTGSGPDCTSEGQPGVPCTTQGKPEVPCTTEGQAGIACTTEGQAGVPCTTQGKPNVLCTTEGQVGIPCTTPGKSGVPKPCTGNGPDKCDVGGPDVPKPCKSGVYIP